jgi:hypothetical protein
MPRRPAPKPQEIRDALTRISQDLGALDKRTTTELRALYRELTKSPTHSHNRRFLIKKCGWYIQANVLGGLSQNAEMRVTKLGDALPDAWHARVVGANSVSSAKTSTKDRDVRLPPVGARLTREHNGETHAVTVLAKGFEYRGQRYHSLSRIASLICGTRRNGFAFFGLA